MSAPGRPPLRRALARARRPLAALVVADLLGAALVAVGPFAPLHAAWSTHPDGDGPLFEPGSPALAELVEAAIARPSASLAAPLAVALAVAAALHLALLAVVAAARGDAPLGPAPTAREAAAVALARWPESLGLGLAARALDALVVVGGVRMIQSTTRAHGADADGLVGALAAIALVAAAGLALVRLVEDGARAALGPGRGLAAAVALLARGVRARGLALGAWLVGGRVLSSALAVAACLFPLGEARGAALAASLALVGCAIAGRALARAGSLVAVAQVLEGVDASGGGAGSAAR